MIGDRLRAAAYALPYLLAIGGLAGAADARRHVAPDLGVVTLDRSHPTVDATVAGIPGKLAVGLDQGLYVDQPFADRLPVTWQAGDDEYVGRVRVRHREAAGDVVIAGTTIAMAIQAQDAPCCGGQDGAIGAIDLPWSVVRIGPGGGASEQLYPTAMDDQSGINIPWKIGGDTIHVVLSLDVPETVATASAAAILSKHYGGRLGNDIRQVPIIYGISRTVRDMTLGQPTSLLGFPLSRIAVRIGDYAGDTELPQPDMPPSEGKDEIVVRHRPPPPQFRWAAITVGRDLLDRCTQISVYRDAGQIGLVCRPN